MSAAYAKFKLKPYDVIATLVKEFKQLAIKEHQLKASENALALAKNCTRIDVECGKCRKKGHIRTECCSKPKRKEQLDNDKQGTKLANVAVENESFTFTTCKILYILL